jgi:hypothetical protein
MLLVFGAMSLLAFRYPVEARLMPLIVGCLGFALCLLQLGFGFGGASRLAAYFRAAPKLGRPGEAVDGYGGSGPASARLELIVWGYFLAFIAALLAFGFYIAVPALVFFYLWRQARVTWPRALFAGAGATAAMYFIFGEVLGFALFPGFVINTALQVLSR